MANPVRIDFSTAQPPARTLASAIVMELRADIVTCRIKPGEKLNISTIAKRFGVSLAAVREALSRLMAAGLVVAEDQRGDAAWRENVMLAWRALQAIPRTLAHDRGAHNEAWTAMHGQFHAALVSACGLQWLMRFRNTLYEQSERYRRMAVAIKSSGRDIDGEHRAIVEAVLAGDADQATREMARHIERTTAAIAEVHR